MIAPPGLSELEAVLAARPATPEVLMLPRDWMAELIRYVRELEAGVREPAAVNGELGV